MIGSNLLTKVIKLEAYPRKQTGVNLHFIYDAIGEKREDKINIYQLAHRCKKWAHKKGFLLDSRVTERGSCFLLSSPVIFEEEISKTFVSESEPEAIFQACQWILENIKE